MNIRGNNFLHKVPHNSPLPFQKHVSPVICFEEVQKVLTFQGDLCHAALWMAEEGMSKKRQQS